VWTYPTKKKKKALLAKHGWKMLEEEELLQGESHQKQEFLGSITLLKGLMAVEGGP
jgi:hypothetical protein